MDIAAAGTIKINTTHGAHFTSPIILDIVKNFEGRMFAAATVAALRLEEALEQLESSQRLIHLAPIRGVHRARLNSTRRVRRALAVKRAIERRAL